jgi:hypothetical protein
VGKRRKVREQQRHAEGEHGPKTEARIVEQLKSGPSKPPTEMVLAQERVRAALSGRRRLVEDRQQHDEGEKNSEHKRLFVEAHRGRAGDGPSDNSGSLHGVLGHREHRADYKVRRPDGLPEKGRP